MTDLTAFLNARLDEDEAAAREAAGVAGPDWTWKTEVPEGYDEPTDYVTSTAGALLLDTMGGIEGEAPHVARHDPARVLREVAVKRTIISVWKDWPGYDLPPGVHDGRDDSERSRDEATKEALEAVVRALATVYSDHPDYREEWMP